MAEINAELLAACRRAEKHVRDLVYKLGADEEEAEQATEYLRAAIAKATQQ